VLRILENRTSDMRDLLGLDATTNMVAASRYEDTTFSHGLIHIFHAGQTKILKHRSHIVHASNTRNKNHSCVGSTEALSKTEMELDGAKFCPTAKKLHIGTRLSL
jgi:hypothetical protein